MAAVDVGRFNKNQQVLEGYGVEKLRGIPALLIVDPRSGKLLNKGRLFALAERHGIWRPRLWLAQWVEG